MEKWNEMISMRQNLRSQIKFDSMEIVEDCISELVDSFKGKENLKDVEISIKNLEGAFIVNLDFRDSMLNKEISFTVDDIISDIENNHIQIKNIYYEGVDKNFYIKSAVEGILVKRLCS